MALAFLLVILITLSNGSSPMDTFGKRNPDLNKQSKFFFGLSGLAGTSGISQGGNQINVVNRGCLLGGGNRLGTCTNLNNCNAALSDKTAGIEPINCAGYPGICCPTEPRISERMCDKYKESLKGYDNIGRYDYWCPVLQHAPRIVRGRNAVQNEFPHMVGLVWGSKNGNLDIKCGGTLISEEYVLTAAHCFKSKHGHPSYIMLGDVSKDLDSRRESRFVLKIKNYITHPDYKWPLVYNDIALVQLEKEVNFTHSIFPACLPNPKLRHELKNIVTVLGWGKLGPKDSQPDTLQALEMQRISNSDCNAYYEDYLAAPWIHPNGTINSQFCAGTDNKDACEGDSGGPATVTNDKLKCIFHVVGVTNFGAKLCGYETPGVYTNVQRYLDWIEQIVWPQVKYI